MKEKDLRFQDELCFQLDLLEVFPSTVKAWLDRCSWPCAVFALPTLSPAGLFVDWCALPFSPAQVGRSALMAPPSPDWQVSFVERYQGQVGLGGSPDDAFMDLVVKMQAMVEPKKEPVGGLSVPSKAGLSDVLEALSSDDPLESLRVLFELGERLGYLDKVLTPAQSERLADLAKERGISCGDLAVNLIRRGLSKSAVGPWSIPADRGGE